MDSGNSNANQPPSAGWLGKWAGAGLSRQIRYPRGGISEWRCLKALSRANPLLK